MLRRWILNQILILIFELSLCLKSKQSLNQVTGKANPSEVKPSPFLPLLPGILLPYVIVTLLLR